MTDNITNKLDELLAVSRSASIPINVRWLDAAGVGAMLGYSARHVAERVACRPDFPRPMRINGGHPRWLAKEVMTWADGQRDAA